MRALSPVVVVVALGACSSREVAEEDTESTIEPIIGGVAATDYPEAALLNMTSASGSFACTASLVAPRVVLTAGHCIDGMSTWKVRIGTVTQTSTSAETYDWAENGASTVNPAHHDVGLVYLTTPVALAAYPTLASAGVPSGTQAVNVGRIKDGVYTSSLWKATVTLGPGSYYGYPFDYASPDVIQPGDSGGPVFQLGTHLLVAVNSGSGSGMQVLARVDLLHAWILARIASHGGLGTTTPPDAGVSPPDGGSGGCVGETEPNDSFGKAGTLATKTCGALSTPSDADYFTFVASAGTTTIAISGVGRLMVGYVSSAGCLPMLTGQTGAVVKVSGGSKKLCVSVSSAEHATGSWVVTRD